MDLFTFDDAYIQRLRERDPATVEHFSNYFREVLSAKIRNWLRGTRSTEELDDVLQEVFLRTLQRLDQVRESSKFGSFVHSVCINVLQEAGRNGNRLVPFEDGSDFADRTDLPREIEKKEVAAAVHLVLAIMPARDAKILRDIWIDEIPREEVGIRHDVTQSYLRVLVLRAKDKFRVIYLRLFGGPPENV